MIPRRYALAALTLILLLQGAAALMRPKSSTAAGATPSAGPPLKVVGYNMDYPGDWTNLPPFIDLMKNSRAVLGECSSVDAACNLTAHLDLDARGWLRSLRYRDDPGLAYASAVIYINTSGSRHDIGERFVVTWDGVGTIDVDNGADVQRDATARRMTFTLRAGNTSLRLLDIDRARTGNYLRNIKVFRASHEALSSSGKLFNPEMLSWLSPFGSLRFMDWMQSNSYGECSGGSRHGQACYAVIDSDCGGGTCLMPGKWQERPTMDQPSLISWGQYLNNAAPELGTKVGGYPVEAMVALANEVRSHPHFNMPAVYTDEYVRSFAEYVRDHLSADLVASVEYSNEVWNWGFPQAHYANALGQQAWPAEGSAWVQLAAGRTHQMCRIWKQVFVFQEHRVRCLISPQTGWPELARTVLDCPAWVASHPGDRDCTRYVDAINITGYFAGCLWDAESTILEWLSAGRSSALDRAFEQLNRGGLIPDCEDDLDATIAGYAYFRSLAAPRGLDLVVYEGGTHFSYSGQNADVQKFLVDVSRDPRMYDAYLRNFDGFWRNGGSTFNAWGWIEPNDPWSHAESALDFTHAKYRAITASAVQTGDIRAVSWRPKIMGCDIAPSSAAAR